MYWFILGIIASLFWGLTTIIDKVVLTKYIKNPFSYQIFLSLALIPISITYYFIFPVEFIPFFSLMGFVGGIVTGLAYLLYNKALIIEEASRVAPLIELSGIFTLIFGFMLLGERLTPLKYLGVILLSAGGFFVSWRNKKLGVSKALFLILAFDIFLALSNIIAKYILGNLPVLSFVFYGMLGTLVGRNIPLFSSNIRKDFFKAVKKVGLKVYLLTLLGMSFAYIAYLVFYKAVSLTYVSLVSALPSLTPFFVLIFTLMMSLIYPKILNEEFTLSTTITKVMAILLVFIGSYLLVL